MRPPAFQFYADDFLGGVIQMTNEERGLYITMLCVQWSRGYVTKDDAKRLSGGMATLSLDHVLSKFESSENGQLRNSRLESERVKQTNYRENQAKQGKIGANARWRRHGDPILSPMANHGSPSPSPKETETETQSPSISRKRFEVPSVEAIKLQCAKIGLAEIEAEKFFNFYESKGWLVGKVKMKSWTASLSGWKSRQDEGKKSSPPQNRKKSEREILEECV